ncbi:hypothetical protein V1523DRAFT_436141 [Lipomyces doorenjongii]
MAGPIECPSIHSFDNPIELFTSRPQTSCLLLPVSIVTGIMSSKTRFIKPFTLTGIVIMCIGFGILTLLQVDSTASERIELGSGVLLATTLLDFGRSLGGVIGVAVSQTILNVSLLSKLAQHNFGVDFDTHTFINNPAAILGLPKDVIDDLMRIYVESIRNVMYFCLACCLAGFVSSVFITNKRIPPPRTVQNPNAIEKDLGTNDMSPQSACESGSGRSGMIQCAARVDVERGDTMGR